MDTGNLEFRLKSLTFIDLCLLLLVLAVRRTVAMT